MTLEELKTRCDENNFKFAYGLFKTPTNPPYLVAHEVGSNNFLADNLVYEKGREIYLEYIFEDKNIEEQNTIEDVILGDIAWNKTDETYLNDENVWQVSYFFIIN
jgi:hypothetical protein